MLLDVQFKTGGIFYLLYRIRKGVPEFNTCKVEGTIRGSFYARDSEVKWATPGTVLMNIPQSDKI